MGKDFFGKGFYMQIHRVKRGESVFHIARAYRTSPVTIIDNNALLRPDALSVGDELLICQPSRSYTVRGTETLGEIANRFSVRRADLLRYNPALCGDETLRPSMTLSIKFSPPEYGTASNLGYVRCETTEKQVREALPYLTYFVFDGGVGDGEGVYCKYAHREMVEYVKREKKIPLLRICSGEMRVDIHRCKKGREDFISKMIAFTKDYGYLGIVLSEDIFALPSRASRDAFLIELRKHLLGSDLILFCECSGKGEFGDFADANILLPSYLAKKTEYSAQHKIHHASGVYETQKTFVGLPMYATDEGDVLSYERMRDIAYTTKKEFLHEKDEMFFEYARYIGGGKRERRQVRAISLSGIQNVLTQVSDYGFMGCAVEIEHFLVPCRLMLTLLFSSVEYAFGFA